MYVMKYTLGGPKYFEEPTYFEHVRVTDKICVVQRPETKDLLTLRGYEIMGEIDHENQLQEFLDTHPNWDPPIESVDTSSINTPVETNLENQMVDLKDIKFAPTEPNKEWWKK